MAAAHFLIGLQDSDLQQKKKNWKSICITMAERVCYKLQTLFLALF